MKLFLVIPTLLISFSATGQEITKAKSTPGNKQFFLGINFSHDYCYRTLKNNDGSEWSDVVISFRDEFEVPKFGYTIGVNALFIVSSHIAFESGVQYSNKGYASRKTYFNFGMPVDPRSGLPYDSILIFPAPYLKPRYSYHYLDVPVRLKLNFGENKIKFSAGLGITANILLESSESILLFHAIDTNAVDAKRELTFNKINFSPSISIGANYNINDKINLSVEPAFRYGVKKIINAKVTGYLWSTGLNITLYYKLK